MTTITPLLKFLHVLCQQDIFRVLLLIVRIHHKFPASNGLYLDPLLLFHQSISKNKNKLYYLYPMRLTDVHADDIKSLAKKHFGQQARVSLFGSKTDDRLKGGDIDLLIASSNEQNLTLKAKIHFLAELKTKIGNRKIDVVFDNQATRKNVNFYQSIVRQKVDLTS